ncbi:tetratricopeptide repeat protein [Methyloglobulus sp.]|uniref:tetratricopeptide repeat protein n=1 Tax=Methyloglobulus sp. TaxID=2518622 RepID=UPI00398A27F7
MANQSVRLRRGQQASYDEPTGFRVYEQPIGWIQKATFGLAFVCLLIVVSVLNIMGKNAQQEPTPSISPEISTNTTTQPEHQANNAEAISQRAYGLYNQGRYAEALPLYQNLAEQGEAKAQTFLGFMYNNGEGVAQDYNQAAYWYRKAADQGNAQTIKMLSELNH